jgi:pimeloyl-ACP methyl ester carboxylesterase
MANEQAATDTVLWLGNAKNAAALRKLVAAQFRVVDGVPAGTARFGVIAESDAAATALLLALDRPDAVTGVVLLGPTLINADGHAADEALVARLGELKSPLLTLFGTKDKTAPPEAGRHYRERLAKANLVFVYDAGAAMGDERPEAVAELAIDFLRRGDTFLVRQASDQLYR